MRSAVCLAGLRLTQFPMWLIENASITAIGEGNSSYVGGIVGVSYGCTVSDCAVYGSIVKTDRTPVNSNFAGGIVGITVESVFESCASVGNEIYYTS